MRRQVRVSHRHLLAAVPQGVLYDPHRGSSHGQMRRKGMSEHVPPHQSDPGQLADTMDVPGGCVVFYRVAAKTRITSSVIDTTLTLQDPKYQCREIGGIHCQKDSGDIRGL
jgi:hypothetical protein